MVDHHHVSLLAGFTFVTNGKKRETVGAELVHRIPRSNGRPAHQSLVELDVLLWQQQQCS
jgi:hypothetical protein